MYPSSGRIAFCCCRICNSASIFYNPASVARQTSFVDITAANTQWIADIQYLNSVVTFAPSDGLYGVFGVSLVSVDYGEIIRTIKGPSGGVMDWGTYSPTALAIGVSYSRALSDKFAVGGDVRYVYQDFGDDHVVGGDFDDIQTKTIDLSTVAFDFGVLYKTGFKSLNFGMSIRNFSQKVKFEEEGFQLPLNFKIGLSMNLFDLLDMDPEKNAFIFAVDAEHPRDNKEMLHIGAEYKFLNILALRIGYITPQTTEAGINAGVGLQYSLGEINLGVDYSYTEFGVFQDVHRYSVKLAL